MPSRNPLFRFELLEDRITPTAGDFDLTFGEGGKSILPSGTFGTATAVTSQTADLKILSAVATTNRFSVTRLTQSGQLDPTFGGNGQFTASFIDYGLNTRTSASAIFIQPDGRIIIAGTVTAESQEKSRLAMARFNSDGSVDSTFGTNGTVTIAFGVESQPPLFADFEGINAAALQSDGRIVVAGGIMTVGPNGEVVGYSAVLFARFMPDGKLDQSFGQNGHQFAPFTPTSNTHSEARAIGVLPDGRIVAVGNADVGGSKQGAVAIRLTPSGQFDPTFGANGRVVVAIPGDQSVARAMSLQPNGGIVLVGDSIGTNPGRVFVARLNSHGQLDPSFAQGGVADIAFPRAEFLGSSASAVMIQGDGKIVIAGEHYFASGNYDMDVARLNADGSPDKSFGSDGVRQIGLELGGTNADLVSDAFLQADGKIVLIGYAANGVGTNPVVIRLLGDRPPLTHRSVLSTGREDSSAQILEPGQPGLRIGAALTTLPGFTGPVRTVSADVTGDGVPDYIIGAGLGGSRVRVLDGKNGTQIADFSAFEPRFTGGVFVAATDMDGDGKAEIVVTPDNGGGPVVAMFSGTGVERFRFFGIEDTAFRGGAQAALGDVSGDGVPDLIVSAGSLGGPRVAIFDGRSLNAHNPVKLVGDFFAFESSLRNGVSVAVGDVTGDGVVDLAFGAGEGGGPRVRLFDGKTLLTAKPFGNVDEIPTAQRANFFAEDPVKQRGVRLALRDTYGDGQVDLITGSGNGEPSLVQVYRATNLLKNTNPSPNQSLNPFDAIMPNGVFVS